MYHRPSRKCSSGAQTFVRFHPVSGALHTAFAGAVNTSLSRRELEVAALLLQGMTDRQIAERLADNLKRYQAGRPCRTPWRADEPLEFSR